MEPVKKSYPEERPVTALPRVGPKLSANLTNLGIVCVKDLLFHFPFRFQDKTKTVPIVSLVNGETVQVSGRITYVHENTRHRRTLTVRFQDDTDAMNMRLFHYSFKQKTSLERASWIRCFGQVRASRQGMEMVHPEYWSFHYPPPAPQSDRLTPVYGLTEGIGQTMMRNLVESAFEFCRRRDISELLPEEVIEEYGLCDLETALSHIHFPKIEESGQPVRDDEQRAMRRLVFEELISFQVARRQQKQLRQAAKAPPMKPAGDLSKRFRDSLAFSPTQSQRVVIREIIADLGSTTPTLRLVQGDVGCGKTLVAAAAAAWAVDSGYQVAIMAPTEMLSDQHFKTLYEWFNPLGVQVLQLTGRMTAQVRRHIERAMKGGRVDIVVGTHALFQEKVEFKHLGLVIVDEQHRFGVGQRFALREKGVDDEQAPHQLVMTATPIPRTLAMAFYADLDVSSITELPPGRIPVKTEVLSSDNRIQAAKRVEALCAAGQQAYWVCPIIDKSDVLDAESAVEAEQFVKQALNARRVGLVHGRLKSQRREQIMNEFRSGNIDVLVATTVIEVGVDVPNASMMVIESAERLGLAQLHQLRGRVGRGAAQATCLLIYKRPLSEMSRKRLKVMRETTDGFRISEQDLRLRGAGELLGTRQTGAQMFRVAELSRDREMLDDVSRTAELVLARYPQLVPPLIRRWTVREGEYSTV